MDLQSYQQIALMASQETDSSIVLQKIVAGLIDSGDHALARIWLLQPGDICDSCELKGECLDQTECLHLVASAGRSVVDPDTHWDHIKGSHQRFPMGARKVGHIAKTGEPLLIEKIIDNCRWLRDPDWARSEKIKSFAGHPLRFQGQVIGVIAIFSRQKFNMNDMAILSGFASHAAAAIANARAFENIKQLQKQLELENTYLKEEIVTEQCCGDIVGQSNPLKATLKQIELVAPTDSNVLIMGESGSGKELIARAIHKNSLRCDRPMVKVNCGSIPRELFESEFFGHVKGAFTGAIADRIGRFQLADGGTLFLDEVGEIPLELQSKLLRVLQEGEIERIGEDKTRQVDVRIIAATNRDLKTEVDDKRFRQDLYYRLSVFPVHIVPLRERKEDIGELAHHLIKVVSKRLGISERPLKQKHIIQLQKYDWPGNVRELQNIIERAIITSPGNQLLFDLPEFKMPKKTTTEIITTDEHAESIYTAQEFKQLEKENILRALRQTRFKISGYDGAANLLQMKPTTLASKIKKYQIQKQLNYNMNQDIKG